jgi:hypothetical protein
MRFHTFLAVFLCAILEWILPAAANTEHIMHLEQGFIGEGVYALDVVSSDTFDSDLRISCLRECKATTPYSEMIKVTGFLGAFGSVDTLITLWGSASVYWVRIYYIHDGSITKVLDQPSRTLPDFQVKSGRPVMALHNDTPGMYLGKMYYGNPPGLTEQECQKIRDETTTYWLWTGSAYVPYHGPVSQTCLPLP